MMLIKPFALLRKGFGVISGINETAGLRYIIANRRITAIMMIVPTMLFNIKKTGINGNAMAQTAVPTNM